MFEEISPSVNVGYGLKKAYQVYFNTAFVPLGRTASVLSARNTSQIALTNLFNACTSDKVPAETLNLVKAELDDMLDEVGRKAEYIGSTNSQKVIGDRVKVLEVLTKKLINLTQRISESSMR